MTSTGMTPAEIGAMSMDHLGWMLCSWREFPPAPIAIQRLEGSLLAVNGFAAHEEPQVQRSASSSFVDEASVRSFVAEINGA